MTRGSCVVVGAGPGIGAATASRFGSAGHPVALVSRRAQQLGALAGDLRAAGVTVTSATADAGSPESLGAALTELEGKLGPPAVLVYNAAALHPGRPDTVTAKSLGADLAVTVGGLVTAVRQALPAMRGAGGGSVLVTGGDLALSPVAAYTALSVGKAAVRALTLCLAQEYGPLGVHVATVTISGFMQPGMPFAPERIAELFWELHSEPPQAWRQEIVYRG